MQQLIDGLFSILKKDNHKTFLTKQEIKHYLTVKRDKLGKKILQPGNSKLGPGIYVWGIPAMAACPGKSALCSSLCYATKNFYRYSGPVKARAVNFVLANRTDFADMVIEEVKERKPNVIRVHDSGDMFSEQYTSAWLRVMKETPDTRFFLFTRSWRVSEVDKVLVEMSKLPNVRLWYSIDRETGFPSSIPKNVRLAYMQVEEADLPKRQVDLVFRDHKVRNGKVAKRVEKALVCPYENGVTRTPKAKRDGFSCTTCGLCWDKLDGSKDPRAHHGETVRGTGRVSLQMLPIAV